MVLVGPLSLLVFVDVLLLVPGSLFGEHLCVFFWYRIWAVIFFVGGRGVLFYPSFQLQIAPRINKDGYMLPIDPWFLETMGPEAPMNRDSFSSDVNLERVGTTNFTLGRSVEQNT